MSRVQQEAFQSISQGDSQWSLYSALVFQPMSPLKGYGL